MECFYGWGKYIKRFFESTSKCPYPAEGSTDKLDLLMLPVLEGLIPYKELYDINLTLEHFSIASEAVLVKRENERRYHEYEHKQAKRS